MYPADQLEVAHPPEPKWERSRYEGKVFYELRAKNAIIEEDSFSKNDTDARLKLAITCGQRPVTISVDCSVQAEKVRLKFDAAGPIDETWIATNTDIFPAHSESLFRRLLKSQTFSIELTPRHRNPQTVIFDLADFKETVGEDKDCR